jgi:hypothetical protein
MRQKAWLRKISNGQILYTTIKKPRKGLFLGRKKHRTSGPAYSHDAPVRKPQNPWVLDWCRGGLTYSNVLLSIQIDLAMSKIWS